jgi:hypothetical protein
MQFAEHCNHQKEDPSIAYCLGPQEQRQQETHTDLLKRSSHLEDILSYRQHKPNNNKTTNKDEREFKTASRSGAWLGDVGKYSASTSLKTSSKSETIRRRIL